MATTSLTVNRATIPANTLTVSGTRNVPSRARGGVAVVLLDPDGEWGSVVDDTKHIKIWGVQVDRGDGAGFGWWVFQGHPTDTSLWLARGSRSRSGGMPSLGNGDDLGGIAGCTVRLAVETDFAVHLGADITVTRD